VDAQVKDYMENWRWMPKYVANLGWPDWLFGGLILALILALVVVYQVTGMGFSRTVNGRVVWGRRKAPTPIEPRQEDQELTAHIERDLFGEISPKGVPNEEKIEQVVRRYGHSPQGKEGIILGLRIRFEICKKEALARGDAKPLMDYFEVIRKIAEVLRSQGVDFGPEYPKILKDISDTADSLGVPVRSKGKKQPPTQWDRLLDNDL
jgi:hypothetical protein